MYILWALVYTLTDAINSTESASIPTTVPTHTTEIPFVCAKKVLPKSYLTIHPVVAHCGTKFYSFVISLEKTFISIFDLLEENWNLPPPDPWKHPKRNSRLQ